MPTENKSNRRLAAILFADIVGYTAMMQSDEGMAMSRHKRYQDVLKSEVTNHQGEIIKNYGDGSLCLFNSVLEAVNCAKTIQKALQEEPKVPLRIGVHLGDVMYRDDDIYGNAVNISSRIESMGVPGSVLMSKNVYDKVKNQSSFSFESYGSFEFKNVDEPMEVFALANDGLVVPKKEEMKGKGKIKGSIIKKWLLLEGIGILILGALIFWYVNKPNGLNLNNSFSLEPTSTLSKEVREKRVAVMVFENQTMNEDLDVFGVMASDFITQGLMEHSNAKVVSAANKNSSVQLASMGRIELAEETGAEVIIEGRYYMRESQLLLHANIVNAYSGEVLHALEPLQGNKDDPMVILDELQQELLGYWILKDEKWIGKNPPKFNAYQEYLKAQEYWQLDQKKTEEHLIRAFKYDSTYFQPLLKLAVNYINFGERDLADTTLQFLSSKNPNLSRFEQMRLEGVKARLKGDRAAMEEEASVYLKMQEEYNIFGVNVVQEYRSLGRWQDCIDVFEKYYSIEEVLSGWVSSVYLADYLFAYFKLGNYEKVIESMDLVSGKVDLFFTVPITHLKALVRSKNMSEVDKYLDLYSKQEYMGFRGKPVHPSLLYFSVCNELYLMHKDELIPKYANQFAELESIDNEAYQVFPWLYSAVGILGGDYSRIYEEYRKEFLDKRQYWKLAILLSKLGRVEEAQEYLAEMEKIDSDNPSQIYLKAAVLLSLGDKAWATELAIESHERGMNFFQRSFSDDWMFRDLQGYPDFEEFVKPK